MSGRERINRDGVAEGRREWTITVCGDCGALYAPTGIVHRAAHGPGWKVAEVRVVEVPSGQEERTEIVGREPYEEVVRVVGEPRAGAVGEGHKPEQVGLSREEIEALLAYVDATMTDDTGEHDDPYAMSARAKLRAYLGQQNDV